MEDGEAFFLKSSLIQVLRLTKMMRSSDFIFFTRIILADADTSVMRYAVKSTVRGQGVGRELVTDCLGKAKGN